MLTEFLICVTLLGSFQYTWHQLKDSSRILKMVVLIFSTFITMEMLFRFQEAKEHQSKTFLLEKDVCPELLKEYGSVFNNVCSRVFEQSSQSLWHLVYEDAKKDFMEIFDLLISQYWPIITFLGSGAFWGLLKLVNKQEIKL